MSVTRFPGLIDVHVHLRDPGATHKEDFSSGSRAAVKGGFTYILDMPNNPTPTISPERLAEKIKLAKQNAICDAGFHYGTDGRNLETFSSVKNKPSVFGLKIYCNHTTGTLLIEDKTTIEEIFKAWNSPKPILVHAETDTLAYILPLNQAYSQHIHVCHVARKEEITMIRHAKRAGHLVTAGVTPHHLFLTEKDRKKMGSFALMKPELGTQTDLNALWEGVNDGTIDLVESDHAPHTTEEKRSQTPPFGVPGLDTTLGLMLMAVHAKKLTLEQIKNLLYDQPKKIFKLPNQNDTYIEFDLEKPYILKKENLQTKCQWSPFENWELYGKVESVALKGKTLMWQGILS